MQLNAEHMWVEVHIFIDTNLCYDYVQVRCDVVLQEDPGAEAGDGSDHQRVLLPQKPRPVQRSHRHALQIRPVRNTRMSFHLSS